MAIELDNLEFELDKALLQREIIDARKALWSTTISSATAKCANTRNKSTADAAESDVWRDRAACLGADPNKFYFDPPLDENDEPYPHRSKEYRDAKELFLEAAVPVCKRCPVRAECLEYANTNYEKAGVWGGLLFVDDRRRNVARVAIVSSQ